MFLCLSSANSRLTKMLGFAAFVTLMILTLKQAHSQKTILITTLTEQYKCEGVTEDTTIGDLQACLAQNNVLYPPSIALCQPPSSYVYNPRSSLNEMTDSTLTLKDYKVRLPYFFASLALDQNYVRVKDEKSTVVSKQTVCLGSTYGDLVKRIIVPDRNGHSMYPDHVNWQLQTTTMTKEQSKELIDDKLVTKVGLFGDKDAVIKVRPWSKSPMVWIPLGYIRNYELFVGRYFKVTRTNAEPAYAMWLDCQDSDCKDFEITSQTEFTVSSTCTSFPAYSRIFFEKDAKVTWLTDTNSNMRTISNLQPFAVYHNDVTYEAVGVFEHGKRLAENPEFINFVADMVKLSIEDRSKEFTLVHSESSQMATYFIAFGQATTTGSGVAEAMAVESNTIESKDNGFFKQIGLYWSVLSPEFKALLIILILFTIAVISIAIWVWQNSQIDDAEDDIVSDIERDLAMSEKMTKL